MSAREPTTDSEVAVSLPGPNAVRPLVRQIAFLPLVGIIVTSTSGGGAYGLEGLFSSSGPGLGLLVLILTPLIYGIPIAAITTELSTAIPAEGGTYVWARRTMGNFMGFQAGWLRWVNSWVDMALYAALFSSYVAMIIPAAGGGEHVLFALGPITVDLHWILGVAGVILPMGILNVLSSKTVGESAVLFSIVTIAPLMTVGVIGIWHVISQGINPVAPFTPEGTSPLTGITLGLSLIMWSYCAFDQVGLISGEIKNPARVIPRAMAVSVVVIVLSYAVPLIGAMAVPGWQSWQAGSFADIALALAGPALQITVIVGGMFSAIGTYSSLLMTCARAPSTLARDGWLPASLGKQSKRTGSPYVAVIVSSIIYAIFNFSSFAKLVIIDVFLINILLLFNLASLVILRVREPGLLRPTRIPFGWFGVVLVGLPLTASVVFLMWLQFSDDPLGSVLAVVLTLGTSTVIYFIARRRRNRTFNRVRREAAVSS